LLPTAKIFDLVITGIFRHTGQKIIVRDKWHQWENTYLPWFIGTYLVPKLELFQIVWNWKPRKPLIYRYFKELYTCNVKTLVIQYLKMDNSRSCVWCAQQALWSTSVRGLEKAGKDLYLDTMPMRPLIPAKCGLMCHSLLREQPTNRLHGIVHSCIPRSRLQTPFN
jgi:hypothetical protein